MNNLKLAASESDADGGSDADGESDVDGESDASDDSSRPLPTSNEVIEILRNLCENKAITVLNKTLEVPQKTLGVPQKITNEVFELSLRSLVIQLDTIENVLFPLS